MYFELRILPRFLVGRYFIEDRFHYALKEKCYGLLVEGGDLEISNIGLL
jgi:hypothetical protein